MTQHVDELAPLAKLAREVKAAAGSIDRNQARALVDLYYRIQRHRIDLNAQVRALSAADRPIEVVDHFARQMGALERQMVSALDTFSTSNEVGAWSRSITGVGPVIAAGLMAYIDIERAPTAGSIWRYAGLDPTLKWHGRTAGRELVDAAFNAEDSDAAAMYWLAKATERRTTGLWHALEVDIPTPQEACADMAAVAGVSYSVIEALFAQRPIHVDNAVEFACAELGVDPRRVYEKIYDGHRVDRTKAKSMLAKRPWNGNLKVLCWKLGDSFVKQSNRANAFYGLLYRKRKELEVERNEAGKFKDQAAETLATKRIQDPLTRAAYEAGMLPPGRLDLRARRYAVKIFLAHWHDVAYRDHHKAEPPKPWVFEWGEGQHVHMIHVPKDGDGDAGMADSSGDEGPLPEDPAI
jgi:hypothetical protein